MSFWGLLRRRPFGVRAGRIRRRQRKRLAGRGIGVFVDFQVFNDGPALFIFQFRADYAMRRQRAGTPGCVPGALPSHGVIGPELKDEERWAIIEYLKIHEDTDAPACKPLALPPSYATCTDTKWAPAKETPK